MPLKTKFIRYPNELQAMGLAQNGSYTISGTQTASEQSMKDCITDIHDFFVNDLGMTHTPTAGELDLGNIPDLGLATYATQYNTLSELQILPYGFKVYAFNDVLQESKPIFIKLSFGAITLNQKLNLADCVNRFSFNLIIDIIYNNTVLLTKNVTQYIKTYRSTATLYDTWFYINNVESNSLGFYSGSKLFCNLIPNRQVGYFRSTNAYNNKTYSYIKFYIERNENYIKFISFTDGRNDTYNGSNIYTTIPLYYVYIPYSTSNNLTTSNNCFVNYLGRNISNNINIVFKTLDIDPSTNICYQNTNVMMGYSNQVSASDVTLDISLDGTNKTYYIINPTAQSEISYVYDTRISTLLKVD